VLLASSWQPAQGQAPRADAAAEKRGAASLARFVPRQDLAFFLEFDGLDAHPAAWRASAAFKLLSQTRLGALVEDLSVQALDLILDAPPPGHRIQGNDILELIKVLARNGFVIAGRPPGARPGLLVAVLRGGARPELIQLVEDLVAADVSRGEDERPEKPAAASKPAPPGVAAKAAARRIQALDMGLVLWSEKGDLIIAQKDSVDEILATIDGKRESALDHPIRLELSKGAGDFHAIAFGFADMGALKKCAPDSVPLGFDGLERLELRCGFQRDAILTVLRAQAPAPRRGLLTLLDQPTFGADGLSFLPAGLNSFTMLSFDPLTAFNQFLDVMKQTEPARAAQLAKPRALDREGLDLRQHLLAHLGPKLAFYGQHVGGEGDSPAAMLAARCAGLTLSIQVRDEAALASILDRLVRAVNRTVERPPPPAVRKVRGRPGPGAPQMSFRKQPGPHLRYVCNLPPTSVPKPFLEAIQPSIALGAGRLVISGSKAAAERALAAAPHPQPAEALLPLLRRLPAEMVYLNIDDLRDVTRLLTRALPILVRQTNAEIALAESRLGKAPKEVYLRLGPEQIPQADELNRLIFPAATTLVVDKQGATLSHREPIPSLGSPLVSGGLLALLWPSVESSRDAARRAQCVNSLKQIALAMHNYHSANNSFPRPAISDDEDKPLLSWRVAILPFLGEQALYNKFKLDEPWDSPHNKALLKEMPGVYLCQTRQKVEPFTTTYRVFTGPGALFEQGADIGVQNVTDGTSNTIMVVESAEAVPWTKPDDLKFDPVAAPSLHGAGSPHPGGFNAAFADGAVRFLKNTINRLTFRFLITRQGGEVVDASQF
jgi:prepilin-type processing-associated H-X9-DG protein